MPTQLYFRSSALKSLDGARQAGTAGPGAPQSLTLTVQSGALQYQFSRPLTFGGAPLWFYVVDISGGAGATTVRLKRFEQSGTFSGLTNGTSYTVTVTPYNGFGAGTAASASATPVSPDPVFNIRTWNADADTGPTQTQTTTYSNQRVVVSSSNLHDLTRVHVDAGDLSWVNLFPDGNWTITDSLIEAPVICAAPAGSQPVISHTKIAPTPTNQYKRGAATGAVSSLIGTLSHCDVYGSQDALQGIRNNDQLTLIEYCQLHGPYPPHYNGETYGGGAPGTATAGSGLLMSPTQEANLKNFEDYAGQTVSTTDFIGRIPTGKTRTAYQVIGIVGGGGSGTLGPINDAEWPSKSYSKLPLGDTTQPFVSGNVQLICIGERGHSDGFQLISGKHCKLYRTKVFHNSNKPVIIQSNSSVNTSHPIYGIEIAESELQAGNSSTPIAFTGVDNDANGSMTGGFLRASDGTWSINPKVGKSRPWAIYFHDNVMPDGLTTGGDIIHPNLDLSNVYTGTRVFVPDMETWIANVGAQHGLNPAVSADHDLLVTMFTGSFDGDPTLWPPVVTSVLEARFTKGLTAGECDARTHPVWWNIRREMDEALLLGVRTGTYYDNQGYWTGG